MALVCDIKSDDCYPQNDEDLEDGEIEDDDEGPEAPAPQAAENSTPQSQSTTSSPTNKPQQLEQAAKAIPDKIDRDKPRDRSKEKREKKHNKDKESRHMTEAEKSILHLRRKERMEREKWNKYRKEQQTVETQDDFAINLEKTLASILKKERGASDEDKEVDRKTSKRKKRGKEIEHKTKQRKTDFSPKAEEVDDMANVANMFLDIMEPKLMEKEERLRSPRSEVSYDSEYSSDHSKLEEKGNRRKENRRDNRKGNKNKNKNRDRNFKRDRSRERKAEPVADAKGICIFYLNGKCNKSDCIYSHEAIPPMKLELCKFYLMDCCAKGENCSYMHSEFPCKFYHMGLPCNMGDDCKFAHGKPLSDGLKQILFKHIETAPRDILGGFPRLSREEALKMMDVTQQNLTGMYQEQSKDDDSDKKAEDPSTDGSIPSLFDIDVPVPMELREENSSVSDTKTRQTEKSRNRPSRWQEADSAENHGNKHFAPFNFAQDQDMRINSNGDIDMRTLPPHPLTSLPQPLPSSLPLNSDLIPMDVTKVHTPSVDMDIRNLNQSIVNFASDVDIRLQSTFEIPNAPVGAQIDQDQRFYGGQDVDIRHMMGPGPPVLNQESEIIENEHKTTAVSCLNVPSDLPKVQRELYLRIQSQQRENPVLEKRRDSREDQELQDTNWYSDDDDDDDENRLTIKDDPEEFANCKEEEIERVEEKDEKIAPISISSFGTTLPSFKPSEVVEKLGDLSKINITADITKLLNTLSALPSVQAAEPVKLPPKDPRHVPEVSSSSPSGMSPTVNFTVSKTSSKTVSDPRLPHDPRSKSTEAPRDPRKGGGSTTAKNEKLSIYEQGGLDLEDIDLRIEGVDDFKVSGRSDVDLRNLSLPFKGMQNYTPATEIDASVSSHLPIPWKVLGVDIPRPDYSGLKLSINDAEKTGDPRLRKIFRLSVEERDTPTSPKASPRASVARIDPRLRKTDELKPANQMPSIDASIMTYNQQLNTLQSSAFYQSLTSNQKLMLNQELASRADPTGSHDPMLNSLLTNLNLIPSTSTAPPLQNQGSTLGAVLSILQNLNKMNNPLSQNGILAGPNNMMNPNPGILNPMGQGVLQPGLLGAAPGIPNMPTDYPPMNFDPRNQNGLLGNGPQTFQNFDPSNNGGAGFQNYPSDDFYPQDNNQGGFRGGNQGRNERSGNFNHRERRRGGRNNFGRNQGNRNQFRRNQGGGRSNRAHTPP